MAAIRAQPKITFPHCIKKLGSARMCPEGEHNSWLLEKNNSCIVYGSKNWHTLQLGTALEVKLFTWWDVEVTFWSSVQPFL